METDWIVHAFGQNVRRARREKGWSQEHLAQVADLDRTYISDIERGARNVSLRTAARLAGALGVDVRLLMAPVGEEVRIG